MQFTHSTSREIDTVRLSKSTGGKFWLLVDIPGSGCLDNPLMHLPRCRMLNQQHPLFLLVQ